MKKDIVADLLNMANAHANGEEAELLNAAASEIDLLRDERDDANRENARLLQSALASQRDADTLLEKLHAAEREIDALREELAAWSVGG